MLRFAVALLFCAVVQLGASLPLTDLQFGPSRGAVVQTSDGPVQGYKKDGLTIYRAIPFAAPPVGSLRWKSPAPVAPWTKTIFSTSSGHMCPQLDVVKGIMLGNEDCLYLDVYVPDACTASTPCAVMQYIYGGAWTVGDVQEFGLYEGSHLAANNKVILVSANYRLDALGWLALDELKAESADHSYGNYGIHDQRAALQWTQRNIGRFGGVPETVTVFGESAGGFSVCQHIVSPQSDRLFAAAIIESGDCDGPWMILDGEDMRAFGKAFAQTKGCAGDDTLACLRRMKVGELLDPYIKWLCPKGTSREYDVWCQKPNSTTPDHRSDAWPTVLPPFAPVAGWTAIVDGTDRGLPDVPLALIKKGKINRSPSGKPIKVIMGTNADEMALFLIALPLIIDGVSLPVSPSSFRKLAQHLGFYHDGWDNKTADLMLGAYPEAEYASEASRFVTAGTDFVFRCGTRTAVRAFAAAGVETYLYEFAYHGSGWVDPATKVCQLDSMVGCGVGHTAELRYVFGNFLNPLDKSGNALSASMQTYWTNLAKFGSPNAPGPDAQVAWPKYDEAQDRHLVLAAPIVNGTALARSRCDFWDSLPRQRHYPH